jgi:tetratricopeptide (TPR) repeat protein
MSALAQEVAPAIATPLPESPYRGLGPFTEKNSEYFFGREEESMTIAANLLTAPVTVLYGTSGVGKSSVLMAGVMPFVRLQRRTTVVLFREWQRSDLIDALNDRVEKAVAEKTEIAVDKKHGFDVCVASAVAATQGALTVVFDQFEEFLLYHGVESESGSAFDRQFARLANREDAPVNFLLGIREDCVAKLDRFLRHIPHFLTNMVRLDGLSVTGARRAIVEPLATYSAALGANATPYTIEPELVDHVLEKVSGAEHLAGDVATGTIETPFLQMIMTEIWKAEKDHGSRVLHMQTLRDLGGADRIVHSYVDDIVQKLPTGLHEVCARLFDRLVTPSRTKIAHSIEDLEEMVGDDCRGGVRQVVTALMTGDRRILRKIRSRTEVARYEIFHDVLAGPILKWRSRYQDEKRARARMRAGRRRLLALCAALLAALTVVAWMTSVEFAARARRSDREAAARFLELASADADRGQPRLAARNLRQARTLYQSFRDSGTGFTAIEEICGRLMEAGHRRRDDSAIAYYQAVADHTMDGKRRIRARIYVANAHLRRGRVEAARQALRGAMADPLFGESPRLQLRVGQLWSVAQDHAQAMTILDRLVSHDKPQQDLTTVADAHYARGVIFDAVGDNDHAREALNSALALKSHFGRAETEAVILGMLAAIDERSGHNERARQNGLLAAQVLRSGGGLESFLDRPER